MPSLRKKVAGFIRQLSANHHAEVVSDENNSAESGCFIHRYLNGAEVGGGATAPSIVHGRSPQELPRKPLGRFAAAGAGSVLAAATGPADGLAAVNKRQRHLSTSDPDVDYIDMQHRQAEQLDRMADNAGRLEEVAGVRDWQQPHAHAYGAATTLYERQPVTQEHAGNPIADCFAVVARQDSAILVLADGVNWGEKACIAARSAVHGCVEHLNKALFASATPPITNTMEVFIALLRSFHAAHSLILQEEGMLTTLTTAVVLPLTTADKYVVCVCNVGDSLAYVYSRQHGVREVTKGSHDIHCMRDMRDALGALGPVDGQNPELNNLTCSMTELEASDIVFITSDGISDNFDPVVGKFAVLPPAGSPTGSLRPAHKPPTAATGSANNNANKAAGRGGKQHSNINKGKMNAMDFSFTNTLPTVQAYQRHELSLLRMDDLLKNGVSGEGPPCCSARSLCELLLDFATRLTAAKRRILEDTDLYYAAGEGEGGLVELSRAEQRARRRKVLDKLAMVPGKLDHASVVAYTAGFGCATRETNL